MESEAWQWIWVVASVVLGLAEIINVIFILLYMPALPVVGFLLPFAIGAAAAAVLAWVNVGLAAQWILFVAVSAAVFGLRRFGIPERWFDSLVERVVGGDEE